MSNIEPTEEQLQKGEQMYAASDYMTSRDFAEILAEREAKLREDLARIIEAVHVQMAATALPQPLIDVVRGVYAEHPYALHRIEDLEKVCHALQDERDTLREEVEALRAERDAAQRHFEASQVVAKVAAAKHTVGLHDEIDTLRARVAELEADCGRLRADRYDAEMRCIGMEDREAQHLARIAELEEIAADLRGDIESDVEKHKREVEVLTKRVAELEADNAVLAEVANDVVDHVLGRPGRVDARRS